MAEKYIIYTMGIKEINEAVQKVLFEKGYVRGTGGYTTPAFSMAQTIWLNVMGSGIFNGSDSIMKKQDCQELTLRGLMELPPVRDEEEEIAQEIYQTIMNYSVGKRDFSAQTFMSWKQQQNWCKIRQKVEEKLGLGLSDAET